MTLSLSGVGKHYNGRWVFRGKNATFDVGLHNVIGTNGSGKSTLIKLILGFEQPSEGEICYTSANNRVIGSIERHVFLVAPYLQVPVFLRVHELVSLYIGSRHISRLLQEASLVNYGGHFFSTLSSGMQQRCLLACAVWSPRSLILMDEPFSHLDKMGHQFGYLALLKIINQQKTCLIATQNPISGEYLKKNAKIKKYLI